MPNQEKLKKLLKDLEKLKAIKDGGANAGLLYDLTTKLEMIKGDKGDVPQKGIDYWTEQEVNQIIREITKSIRIPDDGHTPTKKELVELIKPLNQSRTNG